MSEKPTDTGPPETTESLRREIEQLRVQISRIETERNEYRQAAYALLEKVMPYTPPTEAELHELIHGPRGQPLIEIIEEYERKLSDSRHAAG